MKLSTIILSSCALCICFSSPVTLAKTSHRAKTHAVSAVPQILNKVNINTADAKAMAGKVRGIGRSRAKAIVKYRDQHGRFSKLDDLTKVRGISHRYIVKYRSQLEKAFALS